MYNAVSLRVVGQHTHQQSLSKINPKYLLNTVCTLTSPPSPIVEVQQWVYATVNPDSIFVPGVKLSPWKVLQHLLLITCLLSSSSSALRDWTEMKHWNKLLCLNSKAKVQAMPTKHNRFLLAFVHKTGSLCQERCHSTLVSTYGKHISWKKAVHEGQTRQTPVLVSVISEMSSMVKSFPEIYRRLCHLLQQTSCFTLFTNRLGWSLPRVSTALMHFLMMVNPILSNCAPTKKK